MEEFVLIKFSEYVWLAMNISVDPYSELMKLQTQEFRDWLAIIMMRPGNRRLQHRHFQNIEISKGPIPKEMTVFRTWNNSVKELHYGNI